MTSSPYRVHQACQPEPVPAREERGCSRGVWMEPDQRARMVSNSLSKVMPTATFFHVIGEEASTVGKKPCYIMQKPIINCACVCAIRAPKTPLHGLHMCSEPRHLLPLPTVLQNKSMHTAGD